VSFLNAGWLPRLVLDLAMVVLWLLLMAYRVTGNWVHEVLGVSILVLFVVHNLWNRRWYRWILNPGEGWAGGAIHLVMVVLMLVLFASAALVSHVVFTFIPGNGSFGARQIHVLCAYWGLVLLSLHLGMHWPKVMGGLRSLFGMTGASRLRTWALRVGAMLIVIRGVQASFEAGMGAKLVMYYSFDFGDPEGSMLHIFLRYLSIMGMYAVLGFYGMKTAGCMKRCKVTQ